MAMSTDLSRRLVEAACKRDGVREKLPAAWWTKRYRAAQNADEVDSSYWVYNGPDLTATDQLHNLLKLADAVNGEPVDLRWRTPSGQTHYFSADIQRRVRFGLTRTDAVIAALCAALGVKP